MNNNYTVPMDPELAKRKTGDSSSKTDHEYTAEELEEKTDSDHIIEARKRYHNDRKSQERQWTESYKMYMSWMDTTVNPFLSNLFIPKTHEAVELLSAFLIGTNQSINASPENGGDAQKALVGGKWLDFLWRKVLKARMKILIFIKQGIVFGNGIMKVGWDPVANKTWMANCAIEDVYFDYFEPEIQESEYIIHEVRRPQEDVMKDEKYDALDADGNPIRMSVITGGVMSGFDTEALFNTYDGSMKRSDCDGKVLVMEVHCTRTNKLKTMLPTSNGWRIVRNVDNPNHYNDKEKTPFAPFVKMRFTTSPVPNRAYDTGAVWPTIKIQKAFNDLMNEYFDNVVLVNNKMWIKRRGAKINPAEMVRRPGGVITVSNIDKDLKSEETSDVKSSIIEMLNRLDNEFQQASMIVNLIKGIGGASDTATEATIGQQNVQTLLEMIDQNIIEALSEMGQMVLAISTQNAEGIQTLQLYETDSETGTLDFDPKNLDGMMDLKIAPDRSANQSKAVAAKQMLDFLGVIGKDANTLTKYPSLPKKIYIRWLEDQGVGDADYFFEEENNQATPLTPENPLDKLMGGGPKKPATGEQLSPEAINASATKVPVVLP